MKKLKWVVCLSGPCVLLLGLILLFGQFTLAGHAQTTQQSTAASTNAAKGKLIVVSLSHQWMYVYQDGQQIADSPVTTGQPQLPTPTGVYHIFAKSSPITFHSPWPKSSPYWYAPTTVQYAMEWRAGGYYIHDAWWHTVFGPGTNVRHQDPKYGWQTGSHGCIEIPFDAAKWLYSWAPIGTTVEVER